MGSVISFGYDVFGVLGAILGFVILAALAIAVIYFFCFIFGNIFKAMFTLHKGFAIYCLITLILIIAVAATGGFHA